MAGFGDSAETNTLKLIYQNVTWANVGDATGLVGSGTPGSLYISLHTADPTDSGNQTSSEATYTGYARVAVARSTGGWTVSGTNPTQVANAGLITFGACTAGSNTISHFCVGRASSGSGEIIMSGSLTANLAVSAGITPEFAIGSLVCTLD